ncbi:MAG TPA: DUF6088 family protein [Chroococcales cyanobacterium]
MCTQLVKRHVNTAKLGQLMTSREFLAYGARGAIDQTLHRLVKKGILIRWARGVFSKAFSEPPTAFEVATAKARAFGKIVAEHPSNTARRLKLSAESPETTVFQINGRSSSYRFGDTRIVTKEACAKKFNLANSAVGDAIKALLDVGAKAVTPDLVGKALHAFKTIDKQEMLASAPWIPGWMLKQLPPRRQWSTLDVSQALKKNQAKRKQYEFAIGQPLKLVFESPAVYWIKTFQNAPLKWRDERRSNI